ncbi:MAG: competence/damage-inducible protein A [Candidatus Latescibacterota bacterium]|nr:competence/damage-inducible protein A [Candidatus Latescibacterota bacterium]
MNHQPPIEIYAIGTELLNGQIQDTNSFWMAQQIAALGGYVRRIAILDDDIDELRAVLGDACERGTRMVITTGGLGPTPDDLTVEVLASILGVEVEEDEDMVQRFMKNRGIQNREDVSPGLLKMATRPAGAIAHPNPAGVAPCVQVIKGETAICALPGPPREVEALFRQTLEPMIAEFYSGTRATTRVVVNLPESQCGPILQGVMDALPNTYLKAFVALSERTADGQRLPVDVVAWAQSEEEAVALRAMAMAMFEEQVVEKGSAMEIAEPS